MTSDDDDSDLDGDDLILDEVDDDLHPAVGAPDATLDLNDFDDDFDDDFEAEVTGEYDMDDDEFARQLVDLVDFEIEGLIGSTPEELANDEKADVEDQ